MRLLLQIGDPPLPQFHGEEQRDEGDEPAVRRTEVPRRHGAHLCHPGKLVFSTWVYTYCAF